MKLIKKIEGIYYMSPCNDSLILVRNTDFKNDQLSGSGNQIVRLSNSFDLDVVLHVQVLRFLSFDKGFVYKAGDYEPVKYYDFVEDKEILSADHNFQPFQFRLENDYFFYSQYDEKYNATHFLMKSGLEKIKLSNWYQLETSNTLIKFNSRKNYIEAYSRDHEKLLWSSNSFEEYELNASHQDNNALKVKEVNSLWNVMVSSIEDRLLVQLRAGQIICRDAQTGEDIWLYSENHLRYPKVSSYQGFVYLPTRNKLIEIDGKTGLKTRDLLFENFNIPKTFSPTGPIWIYDKYIVLVHTKPGYVIVIDRHELNFIGSVEIPGIIPANKYSLAIFEGHLYVRGMDEILRIYQLSD